MMTNFFEAFSKNKKEHIKIPDEVLFELNKSLPNNLEYVQENGYRYRVVPKVNQQGNFVTVGTQFELDHERAPELASKLESIPRDKWIEYFVRIQQKIPVKNVKIGNDGFFIPLEETVGNPLSEDKLKNIEGWITPNGFSDYIPITFEMNDGEMVCIHFQQQAYDNLYEIWLRNIDYPALNIDIYLYSPLVERYQGGANTSPDQREKATISVIPKKAKTVAEAVQALKLFDDLLRGKTRVNGQQFTTLSEKDLDGDMVEEAESILSFWTRLSMLEEKLNVHFDPSVNPSAEERKWLQELDLGLNEQEAVVWKHPFDHFRIIDSVSEENEYTESKLMSTEALQVSYIEGPLHLKLLGAEFDVFSYTQITDFAVTNIDWDNENSCCGDVYIKDAPGTEFYLSRLYVTEQDAQKISNDLCGKARWGARNGGNDYR